MRAAKPHTILTRRQIGKYRVRFSTVTSAECMIPHLQIYQPIRYFPTSCVMYLQLQLLYITKSQHNGMKTLSIFACSGSTCSSKKLSHKKWSSIDVPTVFVTSILNQPCFVANLNTYNVIFCHIIESHQISNLYQIIIIVLDEVLRRRNRGLRGPQSHTQQ